MRKQNQGFVNVFFVVALLLAFLSSGCSKLVDIDVAPKGSELEINYYQTNDQILSGLMGVYACTALERENPIAFSKLAMLNTWADEAYAGGGNSSDYQELQNLDSLNKLSSVMGPQTYLWKTDWKGVYRANLLIEKITQGNPNISDTLKKRYIAELKFLRAYYYFELVRYFKNIPLIVAPISSSDWYNIKQVTPDVIYTQIESDLNGAITSLPTIISGSELGRVSKGAAMALLGKVILFQNQTNRMLEAGALFEKVINLGQYSLLSSYANLFNPDNKFNTESIWEISFSGSQASYWGGDKCMGNKYCVMVGPRAVYDKSIYASGWSFNILRPNFVNLMKGDPRYKATVINMDSLATVDGGTYGQGYNHTGYFVAKYAPLKSKIAALGTYELNFPNNIIEIRLADVYLMYAECLVRGGGDISKASNYLNQVRARVGLPNISATLDNIYAERQKELALEGHRWDDLIRTNTATNILQFKKFQAGINDVLPIPLTEISNTKLTQNNGY